MSKVVKLSSVMEREEKLKEIYEGLEEIKDQLTALIDLPEEELKLVARALLPFIPGTQGIFLRLV